MPTDTKTTDAPLFKVYPPDPRATSTYLHTMPALGQHFVKALGYSGHKTGTCVGLEVRATPDGKLLRSWRACISDGMEVASHISMGDEWGWNDWHSITDDEMARASLNALDEAKAAARAAMTATTTGEKVDATTPEAKATKPRPTAPQA